MRISDWSSDVCSSDLRAHANGRRGEAFGVRAGTQRRTAHARAGRAGIHRHATAGDQRVAVLVHRVAAHRHRARTGRLRVLAECRARSEEHTSELQSLMRISYAVFSLNKKITTKTIPH